MSTPGRGRVGRAARPISNIGAGDDPVQHLPGQAPGRGRGAMVKEALKKTSSSNSPTSNSPDSASPEPGSPTGRISLAELRLSPEEEVVIENKQIGKDGQAVDAFVNYVKVNILPGGGIYLYHVTFTPDVDSIQVRGKMMRSEAVRAVIGTTLSFTGMNLYLPKHLGVSSVEIETSMPTDPSRDCKVRMEFVKQPSAVELIPHYNTLFRKVMDQLKMVQINRHFYMPTAKIQVPHLNLEIWPGFVTHIQHFDGGVMLVCDASHRMLRTTTALDLLKDVFKMGQPNFKANALKALVGKVVLTRYNNKSYRIDDVDFNQTPLSTFSKSDGTEVSYFDYFKNHWEETITDMRQPLLIHRPRPKRGESETQVICLVPELATVTGLTDEIRSDFRAMRDIASHTRIKPQIRFEKLCTFLRNVDADPTAKRILGDWGLSLDPKPLELTARILPRENILFGEGKILPVNDRADWSRDATGSRLFSSINITRWIFIYTRRDASDADRLVNMLQEVTRFMGFTFSPPDMVEIPDDTLTNYAQALRARVSKSHQMVMVMTPGFSQREDRYSAIKKLTCCELAIPSQVIRSATVNDPKKARSVCQKVALQIQCKVGGQPWIVKIPFKGVMFLGIDSYHDPLHKGRSVLAVVASIDPNASQWYTRTTFQEPNEEIGNTLQLSMTACLKKFKERNGSLPNRIFVYRDGVGDGQVPLVRDYEVPQFLQAINDMASLEGIPKPPPLSVIIVQKRINTKVCGFWFLVCSFWFVVCGHELFQYHLFQIMVRLNRDLDNPPPGTVVDSLVTRPIYYDFFLVAQHVNQGTVTPTHYITVFDANEMPPDRMQRLTYKLVHLYYNWPGNIRVPSPCQVCLFRPC